MISVEFDRPKLEKSLRIYAKEFGDTTAQAVVRWGVQTCRELSLETQVKKMKGFDSARKVQIRAIMGDAYKVLNVVRSLKFKKGVYLADGDGGKFSVPENMVLSSPGEVFDWIEINRTRRRARTAKLPPDQKKFVSKTIFNAGMKKRIERAGMAKAAWIGAGVVMSRYQRGGDGITIGKNLMPKWAQKFFHFGNSTNPIPGFSPHSQISNSVRHTAHPSIMAPNAFQKASEWGLKKTVKWYSSALRAKDKKQKV